MVVQVDATFEGEPFLSEIIKQQEEEKDKHSSLYALPFVFNKFDGFSLLHLHSGTLSSKRKSAKSFGKKPNRG